MDFPHIHQQKRDVNTGDTNVLSQVGDVQGVNEEYEEIYRRTINRVNGKYALDVGCGNGQHLIKLAQKGFQAVGIERSYHVVVNARLNAEKANSPIYFVVGDIEHMPFKDGCFDVLWCSLIFHRVLKTSTFVKELARVGKGYLFALERNVFDLATLLKFNIHTPFSQRIGEVSHRGAVYPRAVEKKLAEMDFFGFDISWIDKTLPGEEVRGKAERVVHRVSRFFPLRFRCNKFILSCRKFNP